MAPLTATKPSPPRVLVVDDDPDILVFTQALLEDLQFAGQKLEVMTAHSAATAWERLCSSTDIAVALLDVMMERPRAGLELAARVRTRPELRCTRLILRTARTDEVPPLETVTRFDIDAYCDKSQSDPAALLTPLVAALRTHDLLRTLEQEREQLRQTLSERDAMEARLRQAQKLEAVGRLGAGIAHEINTPIQFIQDNMHFIEQSSQDLLDLVHKQSQWLGQALDEPQAAADLKAAALQAANDSDLEFVQEELPAALKRSRDGLERITNIVRAMKDFAHPGQEQAQLCDLNRVVQSSITVAQRELGDCELHLDLGPLPVVPLHAGELGQALLNILLNAAQAMRGQERPQRITLQTWASASEVFLRIQDNGPGISEDIREQIFDPFFTTKPFGEGSGQGLSIAHNVVVRQHGGSLELSDAQPGACFTMALPMLSPSSPSP